MQYIEQQKYFFLDKKRVGSYGERNFSCFLLLLVVGKIVRSIEKELRNGNN
jgi:hypothetical protein